MHLFPADGIFALILSYGQMFSLFLVMMVFEGVIAAKTEKKWPGLVFIGLIVALAVGLAVMYEDISFFAYMMIPVVMCIGAFWFSRRERAKNIARGMEYDEEGLIKDFDKHEDFM